ncbi:3-phenylpropionate/trans-cinnamate dioxygenase ferredoxin subunit [Actinocorallia herbida]|uniref:3-phenylpropionate/trans-cinnamate dioxygenase ferredoxin subunit n=1 Tax=Actinocorallia herbida TaxID=58109 RepID=A0A3N1CSA4_9ACTN|nr:non-heme iron oxygenase ferredoxin subunit [Actinocorallia herbida]ROO84177.1 3-phenylpropionate/trans-cinnamate dioxygenase ferredoxin subunit [Actinocorallia herbida]
MSGYVDIGAVAEIAEDTPVVVEIDDVPVVVVKTGGEVFAINDTCSHAEVSLSEGEVYNGTLECWLHGSCFDLRTGKPTNPPATRAVPTYRVKIEDGKVLVNVAEPSEYGES